MVVGTLLKFPIMNFIKPWVYVGGSLFCEKPCIHVFGGNHAIESLELQVPKYKMLGLQTTYTVLSLNRGPQMHTPNPKHYKVLIVGTLIKRIPNVWNPSCAKSLARQAHPCW